MGKRRGGDYDFNKLKIHIKRTSNHKLSLIDLELMNLVFNFNMIIFTMQNKNLLDIFNTDIEHNEGVHINMKQIINNKSNDYILLIHQLSRSKIQAQDNNVLSTIEIDLFKDN